jgi:betaine reductase
MSREIEKAAGIPVVQIATIVPIMMTVGSNRIVPGIAIPHPVGRPELGEAEDKKTRRKLLEKALEAMVTPIDKQTIFKAF